MNSYYPNLFKPMKIRGFRFKNRMIGAPNSISWLTTDHRPDDDFIKYYETKAAGGLAQVTIGCGMVGADTMKLGGGYFVPGRQLLPRLTELVNALHRHNCIASIQLAHGGCFYPVDYEGRNPAGPSAFLREDGVQVEEMTVERMNEIADQFAEYALLMQEAGFDGIQLHGAHGWLFGQFMAPEFNHRTDEYGGSIENRARFPMMVIERVRQAVGEHFLIEYRISGDEFCEGGHTLQDAIDFCKVIDGKVDLIHVSAARDSTDDGAVITHPTIYRKNGCNVYLAEAIKKEIKTPVITIGAITTPELAEEIIADGKADFVAFARAMMADPEFPNKAKKGKAEDIIPCIRCLTCLTGLQMHDSYNCAVNPVTGREFLTSTIKDAKEKLKVVVVGGGPGGMKAAMTAADRGHDVILLEKTDSLGGLLKFTEYDDLKIDLRRLKNYFITQVNKRNIDIRCNTEATPELMELLKPDAIIVAAGSHPAKPPIPGLDKAVHALTIYDNLSSLGKKIAMVGGGQVGCETAVFLGELGHEVTIIEMQEELAPEANWMEQEGMKPALAKYGIKTMTSATCKEITDKGVAVVTEEGEQFVEADTVVYALGMRANDDVLDLLEDSAQDVVAVGDCVRARKVLSAIHEAYYAVIDLA